MSDANRLPSNNTAASTKFVNSSILLFIDQLIIAAGGWVYWLIISRFATTSEIGESTILVSFVTLLGGLMQLGLEYPLLKKTFDNRAQVLGASFVIESVITLASLPMMFLIISNMNQQLHSFSWIAASMLIASSIGFISRFALLGVSDAKSVVTIDVIGTSMKFLIGYFLISLGFGSFGILISFLTQSVLVSIAMLIIAKRGIKLNLPSIKTVRELVIDGLINTPFKISRTLIFSLTIVLLSVAGVSSSDIGIFYMALMISILAGSFASNMAFMVIPASTESKSDLSANSLRISLTLTSPIVTLLIIIPSPILALIGDEYASAEIMLQILAASILPFAVTINSISKFNNIGSSNRVVLVGLVQLTVFLASFSLLVPQYGTLGTSIAILLAFTASSIPSIIGLEKISFKNFAVSGISIIMGIAAGQGLKIISDQPIIIASLAIVVTSGILLLLKNITISEISQLARSFSSTKPN